MFTFFDNFFQHPKKVCLTYFYHLHFSLKISQKLFTGSIKALMHSFYPDIFITSTTDLIEDIKTDLKTVGCNRD
tara:strand:- start:5604 stop:5825 length:222 start_codon:yes stop_codon:yes gene_type:complete